MKMFFFSLILLVTPGSLFASIPEGCCPLEWHRPLSNPLLKKLPDLDLRSFPEWEDQFISSRPGNMSAILSNLTIAQYEHVDQEILFFQTAFKKRFEESLSRSGQYLPMIQKVIKESGLPEDIVYLPLIESGFKIKAMSRAKASGLWQFMKGTAKQYGLRVDRWIDERYDPEKSTRAAVAYLSDLYRMFQSWPLSMASYNAGEGRIGRALANTGAEDYWTLKEMESIPRETAQYVPKFMAAAMIAKNPAAYGFDVPYRKPIAYDFISIKRQTSLAAISHATGIPILTIKDYNPELRKNTTPPNYPGYLLKLPVGGRVAFLDNQDKLASFSKTSMARVQLKDDDSAPKKIAKLRHKIKRGETIASISRKYNVTASKILQVNRLKKESIIRTGKSLLIPRA